MTLPLWIRRPEPETAAVESGSGADTVGNTRLTSLTGMLLFVLLLIEGVTILNVRQMFSLHIFVGVMLIGPVLLKTGSTTWRFWRYYAGAAAYRRAGPPPLVLRAIGPLLVLAVLGILATGVVLIFVGDRRGDVWLTLHQTCFWVFVALLAVHLLGHLWDAAVWSWADLGRARVGRTGAVRRWRFASLAVALVLGMAAATVLLPHAASWTNRPAGAHFGLPPRGD